MANPVFLNERIFQVEGFPLSRYPEPRSIQSPRYSKPSGGLLGLLGPARPRMVWLILQTIRLYHVNNLAIFIFHDIDARPVG